MLDMLDVRDCSHPAKFDPVFFCSRSPDGIAPSDGKAWVFSERFSANSKYFFAYPYNKDRDSKR